MFNDLLALCVFWGSASVLGYVYIGYPAILSILASLRPRRVTKRETCPKISLIIAAYNEEKVIEEKIKNTLALDYPIGFLEIIVVSDGSRDQTNSILQATTDPRIHVFSYSYRRGKAHALNYAVARASGEILVFSDANVFYEGDALRRLVRNFADKCVGCVCGRVLLSASDRRNRRPLSEGLYMRYERFIHYNESRVYSMIGTDGAMYAVRKELFQALPENTVVDDFVIAMRVLDKGYRIIYEPEAKGVEWVNSSVSSEYKRKVRMIAGGYQSLRILGGIPFRTPLIGFQFVSHKLLRWLSPFALVGMLAGTLSLLDRVEFRILLALQIVFYAFALWGVLSSTTRKGGILSFPYYFCAVNTAALHGLWRFLLNRQRVTWETREDTASR